MPEYHANLCNDNYHVFFTFQTFPSIYLTIIIAYIDLIVLYLLNGLDKQKIDHLHLWVFLELRQRLSDL